MDQVADFSANFRNYFPDRGLPRELIKNDWGTGGANLGGVSEHTLEAVGPKYYRNSVQNTIALMVANRLVGNLTSDVAYL